MRYHSGRHFAKTEQADRGHHGDYALNGSVVILDCLCLGRGGTGICTILDDYSRYILAWRLSTNMAASDVEDTLQMALDKVNVIQAKVKHRPRLLSDNGPAFVSNNLKDYLRQYRLHHIRGSPYHPMTYGKIERYHRSMKNVVKLQAFYFPWELEQAIEDFVSYYNNERYHESLDNLIPADVNFGRAGEVKTRRKEIKQATEVFAACGPK